MNTYDLLTPDLMIEKSGFELVGFNINQKYAVYQKGNCEVTIKWGIQIEDCHIFVSSLDPIKCDGKVMECNQYGLNCAENVAFLMKINEMSEVERFFDAMKGGIA